MDNIFTQIKERKWISAFMGGIALLLAIAIGFEWLRPHVFHGTVLQSPEPAQDFTLDVAGGKTIHLSDFRGKVVLLYFGYTFCPDICPATLGTTAQAIRSMGKQGDDVQLIMISVDPERDTPEKLAQYVAHFHPSFIGATAAPEKIAGIASLYGIYYEKHPGTNATGYLVDHTATLLVIDREGYLKLVFPFGVTSDEIADDLKYMLK